jgi:ABC-type histidine transport system ATPase subunit
VTWGGEVVVRIEDLHKYFGPLEVLKGVDMEVHEGEVVVIFGRSGSGKSTLLRCINFLGDTGPGTSGSRSGRSGCMPGWCSNRSTFSPT